MHKGDFNMLTNKFAFYDINYGEFASITGTNLNTSTAVYAYDNRSDAGNTTWNTTTGDFTYDFGQNVQLDSFFINNTNWQAGEITCNGINKTLLLIHGNNGAGNPLIDSSTEADLLHSITAYNGCAQVATTSKFGSSSIALTGTGYFGITTVNEFSGTGDFGVSMQVRFNDNNAQYLMKTFDGLLSHAHDFSMHIYPNSAGSTLVLNVNGTLSYTVSMPYLSIGVTHHLEINRSGGVIYPFYNGTLANTMPSMSGNITARPLVCGLGHSTGGIATYSNCFVEEIRITNYAPHTANFTPPTAMYTSTSSFATLTAFSLTSNSFYYNHPSTISTSQVRYSFTSTQDSLTGTAGEIIATKQKFALSRNPSKYIPSKTPILKTNRLYNGPIVSTRVGDYFEAQIGWSMLLGDPNTLTNTDLQNVTELARQNISFLFWPNANNDFLNLQTWRKEDVFKCKINDQVSYEFADPDTRSIIADYLIEETK